MKKIIILILSSTSLLCSCEKSNKLITPTSASGTNNIAVTSSGAIYTNKNIRREKREITTVNNNKSHNNTLYIKEYKEYIILYVKYTNRALDPSKEDLYTIIDSDNRKYVFTSKTEFKYRTLTYLKGKIKIYKNNDLIFSNT